MKTAAALWRDRRGASALEFGLIAPLFFAFVFGIVEVGLLLWTQAGLQHGVEIAARCATVNTTLCPTNKPDVIATYASQQAFGLNLPASTFTYAAPRLRQPGERELSVPVSPNPQYGPADADRDSLLSRLTRPSCRSPCGVASEVRSRVRRARPRVTAFELPCGIRDAVPASAATPE
ncbi:pilus assembly protein [Bradyrhizobium sp. ISRA435]|nr:pilus assembly protein [Bradyrhizobium sp. ISRA435]